jgi:hypothetical protein
LLAGSYNEFLAKNCALLLDKLGVDESPLSRRLLPQQLAQLGSTRLQRWFDRNGVASGVACSMDDARLWQADAEALSHTQYSISHSCATSDGNYHIVRTCRRKCDCRPRSGGASVAACDCGARLVMTISQVYAAELGYSVIKPPQSSTAEAKASAASAAAAAMADPMHTPVLTLTVANAVRAAANSAIDKSVRITWNWEHSGHKPADDVRGSLLRLDRLVAEEMKKLCGQPGMKAALVLPRLYAFSRARLVRLGLSDVAAAATDPRYFPSQASVADCRQRIVVSMRRAKASEEHCSCMKAGIV